MGKNGTTRNLVKHTFWALQISFGISEIVSGTLQMPKRNMTFIVGWTVPTTTLQVHGLCLVRHFELLEGPPS